MGRHHGGYVGARMMQDQPESITALAFEIVADPETRKTRLIDFGHDPIVAQTRRTASEHGMVWPFTLRITAMRGPNRYTAGLIEVALKAHIADRTNWRKMLSGSDPGEVDLVEEKVRMGRLMPEGLTTFLSENDQILELSYPVLEYPVKIKSLNFDKDPFVSGKLNGIKGQYLLFDENRVINIRKFGGYLIKFQAL